MKFSDVVGQTSLKHKLIKLSKEGRMSHAMLLCEEQGYGALATALAFVQYNLCLNKSAEDSCGTCPTCNKIQKMIHPDLHFAVPVIQQKKLQLIKNP
jgi:DNA polymerase-3 subunit delta'